MEYTVPRNKKFYVYVAEGDGRYKVGADSMPVTAGHIPIDWCETAEEVEQKLKQWEEHFTAVRTEPEYIKVYKGGSQQLMNLNGELQQLMILLLRHVSPDTLLINLDKGLRSELCDELGLVSVRMFNKRISTLSSKQMIFLRSYNVYQVNPYIFGAKQWSETERIRAEYCIGDEGKLELKGDPPIQLKDWQKKYVKEMAPIFRLAQSTLSPDRLIFGRMDEICKQLTMRPTPQWYKDYLIALWNGEYDERSSQSDVETRND